MEIKVDLDLSRYSLAEIVGFRREGIISLEEFHKELWKRDVEIPHEEE